MRKPHESYIQDVAEMRELFHRAMTIFQNIAWVSHDAACYISSRDQNEEFVRSVPAPVKACYDEFSCPACTTVFPGEFLDAKMYEYRFNYCPECGQRLLWKDETDDT